MIDNVFYNDMANEELQDYVKEIELKKELDFHHEKLMNNEVETMSIDDFEKKHCLKYGL